MAVLSMAAAIPAKAQITINEVLASNGSINTDPDYGANADWIELYNAGQTDVNLSGWSVTDNLDKPRKYTLPEGISIKSGGYLLIWCDGNGTGLHTGFKLSADGEEVGLFDATGQMTDSMTFGPQYGDISYGRSIDVDVLGALGVYVHRCRGAKPVGELDRHDTTRRKRIVGQRDNLGSSRFCRCTGSVALAE